MTTSPLSESDEAPTLTASPACPECQATYTMQDLVFGHPCHAETEVN